MEQDNDEDQIVGRLDSDYFEKLADDIAKGIIVPAPTGICLDFSNAFAEEPRHHHKWDKRFLAMARETASWSKDPAGKVGCLVVDDDRNILSGGYNGFPRGVKDDDRLENKEEKLMIIVHAEANAVAAAARNGHSLKGGTVYITRHPCGQCAALLIQAGIKRIVYQTGDGGKHWSEHNRIAESILLEAGITLELIND